MLHTSLSCTSDTSPTPAAQFVPILYSSCIHCSLDIFSPERPEGGIGKQKTAVSPHARLGHSFRSLADDRFRNHHRLGGGAQLRPGSGGQAGEEGGGEERKGGWGGEREAAVLRASAKTGAYSLFRPNHFGPMGLLNRRNYSNSIPNISLEHHYGVCMYFIEYT